MDDHNDEPSPTKHVGLQIIGGGFARTGTKSTDEALRILGYKIYDTRSMLELKHVHRWVEAANHIQEGDFELVSELLEEIESLGFTATLDFPMNLFAKMFATLRPSAKVLFTERDTDKWFASWRNVNYVLSCFVLRPWSWLVDFTFAGQICAAFDFDFVYASYPDHIERPFPWYERVHFLPSFDMEDSKEKWISFHNRIKRELQQSVPKSNFLAFNVQQGWKPLLTFLNVDNVALENEPFPRLNDIESLKTVRRVMDMIAIALPVVLLMIFALFVYFLVFVFKRVMHSTRSNQKEKTE